MPMMSFHALFSEVAARETRALTTDEQGPLSADTYRLLELYCADKACDCRRVVISVYAEGADEVVATINHAFEPPRGREADLGQTFLDPINKQSAHSRWFLRFFTDMVRSDKAYADRLEQHYRLFKSIVDNPAHPQHQELRALRGDVVPVQRAGPKVGANDPCPCGSGRKYKRCCRV